MKKIVTIGGGTGSFALLSGLKKHPFDLTAIVSMADDGGSTGRLRDELGVLPPGDIRQCLVALSDSSEVLRDLMNYRFEKGELQGHNFGNLFLSALEKITGSFSQGVKEATKILAVQHKVLPVSEENMILQVELNNGKIVVGEKQLDHNEEIRKYGVKKVFFRSTVKINPEIEDEILTADFIVIGPGDLYGSIVPNLLVQGVGTALAKTKAKVIYVCNLTNKKGQTDGFGLDDYVQTINNYARAKIIDYVVYNTALPDQQLLAEYEKQEGNNSLVAFDPTSVRSAEYRVVLANVLHTRRIALNKNDRIAVARSFIRHDPDRLAMVVKEITKLDQPQLIEKII